MEAVGHGIKQPAQELAGRGTGLVRVQLGESEL